MYQETAQQLPAPVFFNFVHIDFAPDAFNFNIGIRANNAENPSLLTRLMATPQFSKIFLSTLAQAVELYEKKFGEIRTPGIDSAKLQAKIRALCTLGKENLN